MAEQEAGAEVVGSLRSVGVIRSALTNRREAPKQGYEGAPDVWLEVHDWATAGLLGVAAADELIKDDARRSRCILAATRRTRSPVCSRRVRQIGPIPWDCIL